MHICCRRRKRKKRLSFSTLSNPPSHESPVNLDTSARPISHFPFPFPLHPPLILNWPSACALSIAYLKLHIFFLFSSPRPADGSIAFRQIPQSFGFPISSAAENGHLLRRDPVPSSVATSPKTICLSPWLDANCCESFLLFERQVC